MDPAPRMILLLLWLTLAATGSAQVPATATPAADPAIRVVGISIIGNRVTRERIILRELLVNEGDSLPSAALYDKLERSRQNLMNTGLFNTVNVVPVYIDMRSVLVEVTVNERWYLWPSLTLQLADPNFNTWWRTRDLSRINYGLYLYKYNFRGQNETVFVMAQFGYTQQYAFRYKIPYIDRRQRWGLAVGGAMLQQAEVTAGTVNNERILLRNPSGSNRDEQLADLELTLRRSHDVRHYWRLGFQQASISDTIAAVAMDYFSGGATHSRFLRLGYSIVWDTRDLRIFPRRGHFGELRLDRLGLGLLDVSAPDITTVYAAAKKWWPLHDLFTAAVSLRGKRTFGTPPYYVQEGLGYGDHVRGYEYYVVDGEHYALGRMNLIFQLVRPRTRRVEAVPLESFRTLYFALYLNAFTDVGHVWDSRYAAMNRLANRWLNGHGIGLDLVTSYDQVVRGEYSFNGLGEHGFFLHFTQPF
jgi:outer membrane protein assembly factor BamA